MTSPENSLRVGWLGSGQQTSPQHKMRGWAPRHHCDGWAACPCPWRWPRSCCPSPAGQPSPSWSCSRNVCKLSMLREQDHSHAQSITRPLPSGRKWAEKVLETLGRRRGTSLPWPPGPPPLTSVVVSVSGQLRRFRRFSLRSIMINLALLWIGVVESVRHPEVKHGNSLTKGKTSNTYLTGGKIIDI